MDSQTIADEIRGLITLGLLDEARAELDRADNLDDPYILEAARRYHLGVGNWENAAKIGLHLLNNFPERRAYPTPLNTSLALYRLGRTAEAAALLCQYPPDDSEPCPTCHYYSLACYLAILGRNQEALGVLNIALNAGSNYWNKSFFDRDLRGLWQWIGDLKSFDEELRVVLADPLWSAVLEGTDSTTDFILDPADLDLHPKLHSLVSYHPSRAIYVPRYGIGPRGRRALHTWQRSRSRWATRRLRSAIVRAASFASTEPEKNGALTPNEIFDHLEKTAISKKPELAAKQKRLLNIWRKQQNG
ncbi:MAG: hypothetical protein K8R87_06760 [Verrucomicrobia bacterium]|nr:hypothetical protein [Verrucomicrobiota bacterium]